MDVSALGRYQFSGHEYFHFHPIASADLVRLITTGVSAAEPRLAGNALVYFEGFSMHGIFHGITGCQENKPLITNDNIGLLRMEWD